MVCIAEIEVGLYCNRMASGLRDCVMIQRNCIVTQQLGRAGVGAGRWASGRAAGAGRAWAPGRALQAAGRVGAVGVQSWRAGGRRSTRQAERAAGGARGRRSARQAGRAAAGAWQAQAGARGAAGWAASAHLGVLSWARLGFCAPRLSFWPGLTQYCS